WYQNLSRHPDDAASCFKGDYGSLSATLITYRGHVLDLGGGFGLAQSFTSDEAFHTVVDPSDEWLDMDASSLAETFAGWGAIRFVVGAGEHLPFGQATFDVVLALWSLNHVFSPPDVLSECARVLRDG